MTSSPRRSREERAELLAVADRRALMGLADDLLGRFDAPTLIAPPQCGTVVLQVREPVCGDRFQLGEAVVSRADVTWMGVDGWGMCLGSDREAALSIALCDAAAEFDAAAARLVDELCARTAEYRAAEDAAEWAALAPTAVVFEELG